MKNKKGFTLIELLAIIVILAIIAVITVPLILGIIDNAKKGTVKDSAYGYKDSINKFYATELLKNSDFSMEDKTYNIDELSQAGVSVSGKQPESNSWITIQNNKMIAACLQFDEYKVDISNENIGEPEIGECEEYVIPVRIISGTKGNLQNGDIIKIGRTEEFYVISSDNSENGKTVLLAKYNINVGYDITLIPSETAPPSQERIELPTPNEIKQDSSFSGYTDNEENYKAAYFSNSPYWMNTTTNPESLKTEYSNGGKYRFDSNHYRFEDQNNNQVYPYVFDSNSTIYDYINGTNGYVSYLKTLGAPSTITGRVLKYEEALLSGCSFDSYGNSTCTGWIKETAFYLGSVVSIYANSTWEISGGQLIRTGTILGNGDSITAGVRPVIEIFTEDI